MLADSLLKPTHYTHLILSMQSLPELGKLAEVNPHVAILVSRVDESLGLGVSHLPADLADEGDQLLGGDHAVTVSIEQLECLEKEKQLSSDGLLVKQSEREAGCEVISPLSAQPR